MRKISNVIKKKRISKQIFFNQEVENFLEKKIFWQNSMYLMIFF